MQKISVGSGTWPSRLTLSTCSRPPPTIWQGLFKILLSVQHMYLEGHSRAIQIICDTFWQFLTL